MRLDPAQVLLPAQVLAVDLAQVTNEEGIFFASAASILIDRLDTALQSIPNQLLCFSSAMIDDGTKVAIYGL